MALSNFLSRVLACVAILAGAGTSRGEEAAVVDGGLRFENITFHDISFTVVRISLDRETLGLYWKGADGKPYQNFHGLRDALQSEGKTVVVATNAGIYAENRSPLGLHVENKVELRSLNHHKGSESNFALKPNGVFLIDDAGARILTTEAYDAAKPAPVLAVQSGPMLVIDGALHPKFKAESLSFHVRNGIGVISPKEVVIVLSKWPVNLYTFATFFAEVLQCANALYLDGTLSGLYAPAINQTAAGLEYVGILAVTRPAKGAGGEGARE